MLKSIIKLVKLLLFGPSTEEPKQTIVVKRKKK